MLETAAHSLDQTYTTKRLPDFLRLVALPQPVAIALVVAGGLAILVALVALVSFTIRRLHDFNLSGWWIVALIVVMAIIPDAGTNSDYLPSIGVLACLAVMAVIPGTVGSNKFGPSSRSEDD